MKQWIIIIAALNLFLGLSAQPLVKAITADSNKQGTSGEEYEGFLTTHWTQSSPYDQFCPMDPVTQQRSYAGCPAVAMAQIINHIRNINGTRFNDNDDYVHYYPNRIYTIDDDFESMNFLSFPELNAYLESIDSFYQVQGTLSSEEAAALIFACGVACQQVYTSAVSGTASVQQAYDGFVRFGFSNCLLMTEADSAMYALLDDNLDHGIPALLAVESPDGNSGHNVVVDGRRDDGKYHINFGFGGQKDGWYKIPDASFPYGLTQLEGIVLNLQTQPLAVKKSEPSPLHIFPNPAHDHIFIEGSDGKTDIAIFNSMGCEVLHHSISGPIRISVGHLAKGMYVVKVSTTQQSHSAKFIIE